MILLQIPNFQSLTPLITNTSHVYTSRNNFHIALLNFVQYFYNFDILKHFMKLSYHCLSIVMPSSKMSLNSNKMKIQFSNTMYALLLELYFGENPIKIGLTIPEILSFQCCSKQYDTKRIGNYYWLYLGINISEFRLILLDHITIVKGLTLTIPYFHLPASINARLPPHADAIDDDPLDSNTSLVSLMVNGQLSGITGIRAFSANVPRIVEG